MDPTPIITRKQAKLDNLKRYFTGKPCVNGHLSERLVSNGCCMECSYKRFNKYYAANPDKMRERDRITYVNNRERILEKKKQYRVEDPAKFKIRDAKTARMRRTLIKQRTPKWANRKRIQEIYLEKYLLTKNTGVEYHVHHQIPLKGKTVCGLHVENNLQIITASENLRLGNRFD